MRVLKDDVPDPRACGRDSEPVLVETGQALGQVV